MNHKEKATLKRVLAQRDVALVEYTRLKTSFDSKVFAVKSELVDGVDTLLKEQQRHHLAVVAELTDKVKYLSAFPEINEAQMTRIVALEATLAERVERLTQLGAAVDHLNAELSSIRADDVRDLRRRLQKKGEDITALTEQVNRAERDLNRAIRFMHLTRDEKAHLLRVLAAAEERHLLPVPASIENSPEAMGT